MGQRFPEYTPGQFFKRFDHVDTVDDPCFGNMYIFKEKEGNRMVNVQNLELDHKGNQTHMNVKENFELRLPPNHILQVYQLFETTGAHMKTHMPDEHWHDDEVVDMIFFESFQGDLQEDFLSRKNPSNYRRYSEKELWNIADACISGLAKMAYYKIPHGNMNLCQVFVSGGVYKLSYVQSVIHILTEGMLDMEEAFHKDILDLGKMLLQLSTLRNSSDDMLENKDKLILEVSKYYSKGWAQFLEEILAPQAFNALQLYEKCANLETLENDYQWQYQPKVEKPVEIPQVRYTYIPQYIPPSFQLAYPYNPRIPNYSVPAYSPTQSLILNQSPQILRESLVQMQPRQSQYIWDSPYRKQPQEILSPGLSLKSSQQLLGQSYVPVQQKLSYIPNPQQFIYNKSGI